MDTPTPQTSTPPPASGETPEQIIARAWQHVGGSGGRYQCVYCQYDAFSVSATHYPSCPIAALTRLTQTIDQDRQTIASLREENARQRWTCFHCGETFTTPGAAADHFGATPENRTGCLIDRVTLEEGGTPERGRGLLMALRKAEAQVQQLTESQTRLREAWQEVLPRLWDHSDVRAKIEALLVSGGGETT